MPAAAKAKPYIAHPHISAEYVDIVSQTVPGLPALGPDVAALLAQDAEYYLRQLIHVAKKRMRHSKRTFLSVEDIYLSDNRRDRQSSLGHFSSPIPRFQSVKSIPGLFVPSDRTLSLFDVLDMSLPPPTPSPSVQSTGIISPYLSFPPHIFSSHATNPLIIAIETIVTCPHKVPPHVVHQTLMKICSSCNPVPIFPILAILRHVMNANATATGNSACLYNVLRTCMALAARPVFGVELFESSLIVIVLTGLIGPYLGRGDAYRIRSLAGDVLYTCLIHVSDDFVRQRVCNTLSSALTDSRSSLPVIYGAVVGLSMLGQDVFERVFVPLLPKLLSALGQISKVADSVEVASAVKEKALHDAAMLSAAVEQSMDCCRLVYRDTGFDVIL